MPCRVFEIDGDPTEWSAVFQNTVEVKLLAECSPAKSNQLPPLTARSSKPSKQKTPLLLKVHVLLEFQHRISNSDHGR